MFSDGGILPSQSSMKGSTQTHFFTSFPNSAIDLDDDDDDELMSTNGPDNHEQTSGYNPPTEEHLQPVTTNIEKQEDIHVWKVEYYQKYFQVDTQQILERLLSSMTPQPKRSYFNSNIRHNPDLYGPIWICITFIISVAIGGNISAYFRLSDADFQIDFSKITLSTIFICLYWWLMPACIYCYFRYYIKRDEYTFPELLCIYGYSLTIFIPVSILWIIPITWFQWLLTILASLISGSVLIVTFWPSVHSGRTPFSALTMLFILFAHFSVAVCIMLVCFRVSDNNLNAKSETTMLTTVASSTKSKI